MPDATDEFFAGIGRRGRDPLLENTTGVARFDITHDGETAHWLVRITDGSVAVSQADLPADAVFTADRAVFNGIASGRTRILAALFRGALYVQGDATLLVLIQRLFPRPESRLGQRVPTAPTGSPRGGDPCCPAWSESSTARTS